MNGHLTPEELQEYRQKSLNPEQFLKTDRHLGECKICQKQLRAVTPAPALPSLLENCADELHLEYEQMAEYLDARMNEAGRQMVEGHINICRRCDKELRRLHAFDGMLAAKIEVAVKHEKNSFWARANAWFRLHQRAMVAASAMAVVMAVMIGIQPSKTGQSAAKVTILGGSSFSGSPMVIAGIVAVAVVAGFILIRLSNKK
jgi:anti-sigma factor RsiW